MFQPRSSSRSRKGSRLERNSSECNFRSFLSGIVFVRVGDITRGRGPCDDRARGGPRSHRRLMTWRHIRKTFSSATYPRHPSRTGLWYCWMHEIQTKVDVRILTLLPENLNEILNLGLIGETNARFANRLRPPPPNNSSCGTAPPPFSTPLIQYPEYTIKLSKCTTVSSKN